MTADKLLILGFKCRQPSPGIGGGVSIKSDLHFNSHFGTSGVLVTSFAAHWIAHINRDVLRRGEVHLKLEVTNLLSGCAIPSYEFIHCIPHNGTEGPKVFKITELDVGRGLRGITQLMEIKLEEMMLLDKDALGEYAFDLVLSTAETLPATLTKNNSNRPTAPVKKPIGSEKSLKDLFPHIHQRMLRLLRDPSSVNVAFIFTIHSCQRSVALWANHTFLDKYPRFQELLDDTEERPTLILIEGISLTTFCVMLKYLYTEDLDLDNIDPDEFLMCDADHLQEELLLSSPSAPSSSLAVLNKSLREHNEAQFYTTWNTKDKVSWSDLFLAADRFEVDGLREQCLENLLTSVDESNAMEILFGVGTCFQEIRQPVMNYISDHLEDIFSIQTSDPFKRFSSHEGYHEVMLELLRLQSRCKVRD
ncbi:hypothetical protein BGX31_003069 [Mortierella sp. GBA43]|nr:hypothetical protein BGX31_003069 [Mortierella sp. GBA43]